MPAATERRRIVADRGDAGVRLDRVLQRHLADVSGVSRTRVQRWIAEGAVLVGGRPARRVAARVALGDDIVVEVAVRPPRRRPRAEMHPLAVLHEDADVIVLDKPPHVVVHPSYKHASGTVLNALLGRSDQQGGSWTPRLVHRLDKDTSGVLLVAKRLDAHARLTRAWHCALVEKIYLAIVVGHPPRRDGDIRLCLARDPVDARRVVASPTRGRDSLTRYKVLAVSKGLRAGVALVRCELVTGRMHQVRVHLASIGCPIAGDRVYGNLHARPLEDPRLAGAIRAVPRHALHAWRLTIPECEPGAPRQFVAPLPADMTQLLDAAGIAVEAALARA